MPPKQAAKKNEPSKKTQDKTKQKIIEDKTFGLKNKKGAKQQKFINTVQKQVTYGHKSAREMEKLKEDQKNKKDIKKKEADELNQLFKPVVELQKCGKGVDPKSVLCVFFKQGMCGKGDKCKFSHDLGIARKTEKRSLYDDVGASGGDGGGGMDTWDQAQLEEVVNKRHGDANKGLPPTAIICKYFLDAVESSKYGWFWKCPNGEKCHYRHALPPGFVLKKDKKKMAEQKEELSLEELIEKERASLGPKQTPVTIESFLAWKKRKREEKKQKADKEKAKRKDEFARGRMLGVCGREIFEFNPDMVDDQDSDDEGVVDSYQREVNEEEEYEIHEINLNDFDECVNGDNAMSNGATSEAPLLGATAAVDLPNGSACSGEGVGATAGAVAGAEADAAVTAALGAVALDEQLFLVDDDELNAMDDELDTLTLS